MKAIVSSIQRFSINDGPGIRTTVFLKGCPLRCMWCQNPECISPDSEIMCYSDAANGDRLRRLSTDARLLQQLRSGKYISLESLDKDSAACVESCYAGDAVIVGEEMSLEDVMDEIKRDMIFFEQSEGGVTVSGGEPLSQAEFLAALLQDCRKHGIHTAIDTCGHVDWRNIELALPHTDMFLFDLKHIDPRKHREYTGVSNDLILENLRRLSTTAVELTVSIPVIPRFNDGTRDVRKVGEFLLGLRGRIAVRLLAYHRFAESKYKALGMPYPMPEISQGEIRQSKRRFRDVLMHLGITTRD